MTDDRVADLSEQGYDGSWIELSYPSYLGGGTYWAKNYRYWLRAVDGFVHSAAATEEEAARLMEGFNPDMVSIFDRQKGRSEA